MTAVLHPGLAAVAPDVAQHRHGQQHGHLCPAAAAAASAAASAGPDIVILARQDRHLQLGSRTAEPGLPSAPVVAAPATAAAAAGGFDPAPAAAAASHVPGLVCTVLVVVRSCAGHPGV